MTALPIALKVIDGYLGYQSRHAPCAGFQVSIRKRGQLVFSKAYGFANADRKTPYSVDSLGHIASHSKIFAAALAMILEQEGKLKLTDPVARHLPEFKNHPDKRFQDITIEHLITNRSGIFRDGHDCSFWDLDKAFLSRREVVDEILASRLCYKPGIVTKYSNMGFSLLGMIFEAVTDESYAGILENRILSKLKGKKLVFPDYDPKMKSQFADGHTMPLYDRKMKVFKHAPANGMITATGICATADGISDFLYKLYFTDMFLSEKNRRKIMTRKWPVMNMKTASYGFGTMFIQETKNVFIGHSGGYPGFVSMTAALKESDYIFSVIFNCLSPLPGHTLRTIAEIIQAVEKNFAGAKGKTEVSGPMMTKWGADIFVRGPKTALGFLLGNWLLSEAAVLKRRKDGAYYADSVSGYESPGEAVKFTLKNGKITSVQTGGTVSYPEKEFLKRGRGFRAAPKPRFA